MNATFVLQHPILQQTLQENPAARAIWEESDVTENDEQLLLFWVETEDYDAVEGSMHEDPTVTGVTCLTAFSDRRLYQAEVIGEARTRYIYPTLVEVGGIVEECVGTDEGWTLDVEFPGQEALQHFYSVCEHYDLEFRLVQKYEQSNDARATQDYGLTEKQRDALELATEMGYFDIPRGADLSEVADEMGISHQAASERVRRGVGVLIRHTIAPQDESPAQGMD